MKRFPLIVFAVLCFASCSTAPTAQRFQSADLVPMYGGMDRASVPLLKKADDAFIQSTASAFGGRKEAAKVLVEQAFALYAHDDLEMAMRRFNQAWLLDPANPKIYWGFGSALHDRGAVSGAYDMLQRAYKLGFRHAGFLADLGRVAVLQAVEARDLSPEQRKAFIFESENYYTEAIKGGGNLGYIYDSWSTAKYWAGDYPGALEKVKLAWAYGGAQNDHFLTLLAAKLPEPK
jgi:tetratricopeptide (TPR) repeat protein